MSADDDARPTGRSGWFMHAAGVVGDLDHPFYREERQRDVWNEACAVGLQVALWLGLALAAAMVWLGGATALPYALAVVVVLVVTTSGVTVHYARQMGVRVDDPEGLLRLRLVPYLALLVLFFVGAIRATPLDGFLGGMAWGAPLGAAAGLLSLVRSGLRARRRARRGQV